MPRPARDRSAAGQTISSTVTPAGGSTVSTVGMRGALARLVRLRVQPFGERDLERDPDGIARADGPFDERRDVGARTQALRVAHGPEAAKDERGDEERFTIVRGPGWLYSTS